MMTDPELAIAADNIRAVGKILEQHEAHIVKLRHVLRYALQGLRNVRERMATEEI